MEAIPSYSKSLRSSATIRIGTNAVHVLTGAFADTERSVGVYFGPLSMGCTPEEAIELGSVLIDAAHHWRAAMAEYKQHQAEQAATQGGAE